MSKVIETSLVIKKETIYDKMRNAFFLFINGNDDGGFRGSFRRINRWRFFGNGFKM